MISIIQGVELYTPKYIGRKDIVVSGGKFQGIYEGVKLNTNIEDINIINAENLLMFPGFIDNHVHIIGGGGEAGFRSRVLEITSEKLVRSGITTVVGCLGTDNVCRSTHELIAKTKALEEEGLSAFCYTGAYEIPIKTVTNSIKEDLMLIDKIIGVGEIAISDNRSSQPTYQEFISTVAQSRVGGLLSGKSGIVNVHVGDGKRGLEKINRMIENTEIPFTQILPTHINRNMRLFREGMEYLRKGGYIDLTTSSSDIENDELTASKALKLLFDEGLPLERVTFSSDGNGSIPIFDEYGNIKSFEVCSVETLYEQIKTSILDYGVPIETAISVITKNVSKLYGFNNKGVIEKDRDADFVLVDRNNLEIKKVFAKGKLMFGV